MWGVEGRRGAGEEMRERRRAFSDSAGVMSGFFRSFGGGVGLLERGWYCAKAQYVCAFVWLSNSPMWYFAVSVLETLCWASVIL